MARTKATLTLPNGANIVVEGSPSEVAAIMHQLGLRSTKVSGTSGQHTTVKTRTPSDKRIKTSPTDLILTLADGGFFKTPKDLAAIKEGLAEIGHIYPIQTLSSLVFKMVRRRYLRRIKEEGRWVYMR